MSEVKEDRQLRQCHVCKEWFNTTRWILLKHRIQRHPEAVDPRVLKFFTDARYLIAALRGIEE